MIKLAKKHYKTLEPPITCNESTYVKEWAYQESVKLKASEPLNKDEIVQYFKNYFEHFCSSNSIPPLGVNDLEKSIINTREALNNNGETMCQITIPQSWTNDYIFEQYADKYPLLHTFKFKIDIKPGNHSVTRYHVETDRLEVTYNNSCDHQRVENLLHELGHVSFILECFSQNHPTNFYSRIQHEIAAISRCDNLSTKLSQPLAQAIKAGYVTVLTTTLREIETYTGTNHSPQLFTSLPMTFAILHLYSPTSFLPHLSLD